MKHIARFVLLAIFVAFISVFALGVQRFVYATSVALPATQQSVVSVTKDGVDTPARRQQAEIAKLKELKDAQNIRSTLLVTLFILCVIIVVILVLALRRRDRSPPPWKFPKSSDVRDKK